MTILYLICRATSTDLSLIPQLQHQRPRPYRIAKICHRRRRRPIRLGALALTDVYQH